MNKRLTAVGIGGGAAALVAAGIGGVTIAAAQDDNNEGGSDHRLVHGGPKGEPMTAADVQQATAAAEQAVPDGTVQHTFPRPDGYVVGVVKEDGSRVAVLLDDGFALVEVKEAPERGDGPRGEPVTGQEARSARAAARKAVPKATVEHVLARPDGGYAVMMAKNNGKHRLVLLDEDFTVADVVKDPRGPRGPHGKPLTGKQRKKAEAAALAEVSGGTVMGAHKESDGYDVMVRTDDGVVRVELNKRFKVTGTDDVGGFRGPGGHRGPGMHGPGFGPGMGGPGFGQDEADADAGATTSA